MNLITVEASLQQAQDELWAATHSNYPAAIAIAQQKVTRWERQLFLARLEDEGGWTK